MSDAARKEPERAARSETKTTSFSCSSLQCLIRRAHVEKPGELFTNSVDVLHVLFFLRWGGGALNQYVWNPSTPDNSAPNVPLSTGKKCVGVSWAALFHARFVRRDMLSDFISNQTLFSLSNVKKQMEIASSVRRINRQIHEGNQVWPDVELCFPVVGNLAALIPNSIHI